MCVCVLIQAEREGTTGRGWFNMPAPEVTPEMKNDLRVLQMRDVLDRSHHYKSSDWKKGKLPKYFQASSAHNAIPCYHSNPSSPGGYCGEWGSRVLLCSYSQETAEEDNSGGAAG